MPTIKETNQEKMKTAMKGGDKDTVQYTRNLHAAIRKKEIDDRVDLVDADVIKIISSMLKQREESITQFKAGGREDLVAAEEKEAIYLRQYMPTQMTEAEISALVGQVVGEVQAKDVKDLGKVMKVLQPLVAGKADGKLVTELVRKQLGA